MVEYNSIAKYLETATSLEGKIAKLDQLINAMLDKTILAVGDADLDEYAVDNGQTKIRAKYRDMNALTSSIEALQKVRDTWQAQLNNNTVGRVSRMVDSKNFRQC